MLNGIGICLMTKTSYLDANLASNGMHNSVLAMFRKKQLEMFLFDYLTIWAKLIFLVGR